LLFSLIARAQPNYLVPDPTGCGVALNNNGQILCRTGLYSNNTFTPFPAGFTGWALSESGVVAGYTAATHLATYSAGVVTDLGELPGSPQQVYPTAINPSGQIAGSMYIPAVAGDTGFVYSSGATATIENFTDANGMNDSGQVVGCFAPPAARDAFLYENGALTDLGPGCATAINASGEITGGIGDANSQHAFLWSNGKLTVLTEPPPFNFSAGGAINNGGQIVGGMMGPPNLLTVFFYNGVMTDINSLVSASDPLKATVRIDEAWAITDSRMMLVSAVSRNGTAASYLLQAPWLDVAPGPLTFTSQDVGTKSQPQILTLTNSGTAPLSLDSISIASGGTDFGQTNTCPQSLASGANCTVSVTFSPSKPGDQSTFLNVVTAGATITVPLAATAAITITMSESTNPVNPSVGNMFTITWSATAGSTCQSSGGTANDGWSATTTSGSASVIEAQPGVYTYNLTCAAGSVSTAKSLKVTVASASPSGGGGGGGALDVWSLLLIGGLLVLKLATIFSACEAGRDHQNNVRTEHANKDVRQKQREAPAIRCCIACATTHG